DGARTGQALTIMGWRSYVNKPETALRLAHAPEELLPPDPAEASHTHLPGPPPHGGRLTSRLAHPDERDRWLDQVPHLPSVILTPREVADIECLAVGAFSPLEGCLGKSDHESGLALRRAGGVVRRGPLGGPLAVLHLEEVFAYDREEEAEGVFRTSDPAHPGVAALLAQGEWLLGGRVTVLRLPRGRPFVSYRLTPREVRLAVADRGWRTVVGFQTRNPIHRAHEYLTKCALEQVDGLLLHPLVGERKGHDIPDDFRVQAYEVLMEGYYPKDRVLLSVFVAAMRYAGPREALFHAICRKNYGCTHFIVGRDHAGVGNFYGTFDAQDLLREFE